MPRTRYVPKLDDDYYFAPRHTNDGKVAYSLSLSERIQNVLFDAEQMTIPTGEQLVLDARQLFLQTKEMFRYCVAAGKISEQVALGANWSWYDVRKCKDDYAKEVESMGDLAPELSEKIRAKKAELQSQIEAIINSGITPTPSHEAALYMYRIMYINSSATLQAFVATEDATALLFTDTFTTPIINPVAYALAIARCAGVTYRSRERLHVSSMLFTYHDGYQHMSLSEVGKTARGELPQPPQVQKPPQGKTPVPTPTPGGSDPLQAVTDAWL